MAPARTRASGLRLKGLIGLGLAALVLLAFAPAVRNGFVNYDDPAYIYENDRVTAGLTWSGCVWAFTSAHAANWHPLTWLSHMADCELFGLRAGAHHAVSVGVHAVNAVLLFLVLAGLTGATWRSAAVAAVFAVHPLRVESVAWAAERKDVLSGLFWIAALGLYGWYARRPDWRRYGAVALCFALGLLAKPMLVTLPFVFLLLDVWPLGRVRGAVWGAGEGTGSGGGDPWGRLIAEKVPLLVLSAAACVVTIHAQRQAEAVLALDALPFRLRAANALTATLGYVQKLVWPRGLAVLYPHPGASAWGAEAVAAGALLAAVTVAAVLAVRRAPYVFTGWFWFAGTLVPVIGLAQVGQQAMADRYTYLTQVGLLVAAAWGVEALTRAWRLRGSLFGAAAVAVLAALVLTTRAQVGVWRDSITLFTHALAWTERNGVAHANLGEALERAGRTDEAIGHYREALRIDPRNPDALYNWGNALLKQGSIDEAIERYEAALRIRPADRDEIYSNIGAAYDAKGDAERALAHFRRALEINPGHAVTHFNIALILADRNDTTEAQRHLKEAVRLDPEDAEAWLTLGSVSGRSGDRSGYARACIERARALAEARGDADIARRAAEALSP